jgi:hypothetical protein
MYTLAAIQIEKNVYAIPTTKGYNNHTYCYMFEGNDFNWDVTYSCGKYIDDGKLYGMAMIDNVLEMGSDEVESLHDLNYWEDIEEYFIEF